MLCVWVIFQYILSKFSFISGKALMSLLGQTLDQTARSSLIKDLKRQLILWAAKNLNCDKVFTGECATSLAITLLSGKAICIRSADINERTVGQFWDPLSTPKIVS